MAASPASTTCSPAIAVTSATRPRRRPTHWRTRWSSSRSPTPATRSFTGRSGGAAWPRSSARRAGDCSAGDRRAALRYVAAAIGTGGLSRSFWIGTSPRQGRDRPATARRHRPTLKPMMTSRFPFLDVPAAYGELQQELDAAARRVMASGQFILGPEVAAFEEEFAAYCGTRHADRRRQRPRRAAAHPPGLRASGQATR